MSQKSDSPKTTSERLVKDVRWATRRRHSEGEKIRIAPDGLRGEHSSRELRRREGMAETVYYSGRRSFLEAGKRR